MLDVALPFESMLNPSCCTGFSRVVHRHKRLIFIIHGVIFYIARCYATSFCNPKENSNLTFSFVVTSRSFQGNYC